jgi:hypothetical protein
MRVMMMIKGDRDPGHMPGEQLMTEMARYNEDLTRAGVLLDLARSIGAPKAFGWGSPSISAP